jgi:hypothetical protein
LKRIWLSFHMTPRTVFSFWLEYVLQGGSNLSPAIIPQISLDNSIHSLKLI